MKHWYRSIYSILFIALLLIIFPLQATQFSMYRWGRDAVSDELNSAAASNVIYLRDNFVENIQSINVQLEYLMTNSTITSFFINHDHLAVWDYYVTVAQINTLLALIEYSNPYLEEIVLYYTDYNISLSSDEKIETVETDLMNRIITEFRQQNSLLMEADGYMAIGHMVPSTAYFKDELPQYFVEVILSEAAVRDHLSSFSQYSNKNALMINHNTGTAIKSTENMLGNTEDLSSLIALIKPQDSNSVYQSSVVLNGESYVVVACYSKPINCSFAQLIPAETMQTIPNRFAFFIVLFNALALVVVTLFLLIMYRLVKRPMNDLMNAFSVTGSGDFSYQLALHYASYEYNELVAQFNAMTERIKELIQSNYEQTIRLQHAELKQLQAQINPHFLYNSFFFLRHMIGRNHDDQAKSFASYMGKYFKYITKSDVNLVPLQMEYEHAANYLSIQQMRFEDDIRCEIEAIPEAYSTMLVPRLILQPIFENVLVHGIRKSGGESVVRMFFSQEDACFLHILIEDNGDQLTDDKLIQLQQNLNLDTPINETTGLINIHKRLKLYFNSDCGLIVSRSKLGGLLVQLTVALPSTKEYTT
ncbi:MAG: histidine kinase [Bacillota bacterium]|nr:histidine kinase [Bacillota bacterium]